MTLTGDEQAWLDAYRRALTERLPGVVDEIVVYGSKARGDARPESDLDALVIIMEGNRQRKREVRHLGHRLAVTSEAVPSIMVYTRGEWATRERSGSPLHRAVTRDGVRVAMTTAQRNPRPEETGARPGRGSRQRSNSATCARSSPP